MNSGAIETVSGICVLSRSRQDYASEPSQCCCDEHVSYLVDIGSLYPDMVIDADGVQILLYCIQKTKHLDSLLDARLELNSAMTSEAQEGGR